MAARVTLVSSGHLASNPRLVKEADALAEAGYRASVVAVQHMGQLSKLDAGLVRARSWPLVTVSFDPRVRPWLNAWSGLRNRACRGLPEWTWPLTATRAVGRVAPELARAAGEVESDLVIAHNLAALPAAASAARRRGARLGFDLEDFHSGELAATPANRKAIRLLEWLERRFLGRCDYLTAASPGIAREYAVKYALREPTAVLNVFPLSEAPPTRRPPDATPGPSLYWFSQTVGPERGLEDAVDALAKTRTPAHLHLRGLPAAGYPERLRERARRLGVSDRLHFLGLAEPGEMVRLASAYSAGLALEQPVNRNREICLTNKLFTYWLAGIPVIASGTEGQEEACRGFEDAAALYPPGDSAAMAEAIDRVLSDPAGLERRRQAAWDLGRNRFNWDREKGKFLQLVADVLAVDGRGGKPA